MLFVGVIDIIFFISIIYIVSCVAVYYYNLYRSTDHIDVPHLQLTKPCTILDFNRVFNEYIHNSEVKIYTKENQLHIIWDFTIFDMPLNTEYSDKINYRICLVTDLTGTFYNGTIETNQYTHNYDCWKTFRRHFYQIFRELKGNVY